MSTVAREDHKPPKVKTFGINHAGDVEQFEYEAQHTIEHEIVVAIARFHLAAQPHQLGLFKQGQSAPLTPQLTLAQAHVEPGEVLILKPIVVQGGQG